MKGKKGEITGAGVLLLAFVGVIVGIALFQAVAQSVGTSTSTVSATEVFVAPVNGTAIYFDAYKNFGGTIAATNGTAITSDQYTITNNVINPTTGSLSVKLVPAANATYAQKTWTLTSTVAQKVDYIDDSAGRSIAALIVIFMALAIAVIALVPTLRNGILDMVR